MRRDYYRAGRSDTGAVFLEHQTNKSAPYIMADRFIDEDTGSVCVDFRASCEVTAVIDMGDNSVCLTITSGGVPVDLFLTCTADELVKQIRSHT